jgi:hypothetical protein
MTQALLPWGIKSVRQVDTEPALGEALVRLTTNSLHRLQPSAGVRIFGG